MNRTFRRDLDHEEERRAVPFGVKSFLWLLPFYSFLCSTSLRAEIDFAKEIRPILSENCFHCHGPDAADRKAGIRLDTHEGALEVITAGKHHDSEMWARIVSDDPDELMPPPDSNRTLTEKQKALLKQWIDEGATWAGHWSFEAPERPEVPDAAPHPIDAFIRARLETEGIAPSPRAEPHTLIRRLTLDLTGLPPTPAEVDDFLAANEADPEKAWTDAIDRLLASPRYGEHMALAWLDAARYADTDGYQFDGPRVMWPWRNWVIEAYNQHMPFDQFTIEQLAGDLLDHPTVEQRIATGFNRNHRYNSESGLVPEEFQLENAVDRVDTTSTLWMGLTISCARCHDHKYDPISTKEYYQLIAFFNNIPESGRAVKARNSAPFMPAPNKAQQQKILELEAKVKATQAAMDSKETREAIEAWAAKAANGKAKAGGVAMGFAKQSLFETFDTKTNTWKAVEGQIAFEKGVFGQALKLDGKSIVSVPAGKGVSGLRANQQFSIALWVKAESDGVFFARQKGGTTKPGVELALVDGKLRFDLVTRWIAGVGRVTTKADFPKKRWVHVAITCDGSQDARGQHIYLDGKRVEATVGLNINSNTGGSDNQPMRFGGGIWKESQRFKGAVDTLSIYNRVLWPDEVAALSEKTFVSAIVKMPREKRTPHQDLKMRTWFLQHAASKELKKQFNEAQAARNALALYLRKLPDVMVMEENPKPKRTYVRTRGIYDSLGEEVQREVPEIMPSLAKDARRDRLGFARWLMNGEHPLTARVAVNRHWMRFFGTGLVKTAEDFGIQGEAPSHPALLDWLAVEYAEKGWDTAALQKLMLTSETYRQRSVGRPELAAIDADNRLLARAPRIRLTGQAMRDQALFVSGLLKERIGGPSVSPYQPANLWAEMSMGQTYKQSKGDDLFRRSLYTIWKRTIAPPSMAVFDAADREQCWVKSNRTNTPLQALTLLNETGFVESARHFGARLLRSDDPVEMGFKSVTARSPNTDERALLQAAWDQYQALYKDDAKAAAELLKIGESSKIQGLDDGPLAGATAFANVLLNLDESINRE